MVEVTIVAVDLTMRLNSLLAPGRAFVRKVRDAIAGSPWSWPVLIITPTAIAATSGGLVAEGVTSGVVAGIIAMSVRRGSPRDQRGR